MTHRIAVLVADGVNGFELAVTGEVFANRRPKLALDWYQYEVCGPEGGEVQLSGGMYLRVSHDLDRVANADTVIVPAWVKPSKTYDERLLQVLRAANDGGSRIVSLCTGAFLLAAAGLLDGRPVTTHWQHAALLQEWYPSVSVEPDRLYVDAGDILSSAGSSAALDLSLYLVSKDHGSAVAADLARHLVLAPHRAGGQTQFAVKPIPTPAAGDPIATAMAWALTRLGETLRVRDLAQVATMSERTFARQFDASTGMSPMRWLQEQRVETAKGLLEMTGLAIPVIAIRVGLGSPANFRNHFLRHVGISPSRYRQSFNATVAS